MRTLIRSVRGVSHRQAQRIIVAGEGKYWHRDPAHLRLAAGWRVALALNVERVSRPHVVRIEKLQQGEAALKAALAATVYRTDEQGVPITRRLASELTGLAPATLRRYENTYGHADLVEAVYVRQAHLGPTAPVGQILSAGRGWGFFIGRAGHVMRRHGDIRRSCHDIGPPSSARHLNRKLSRSCGPVVKARGQQHLRVYFMQDGARAAAAFLRCKYALGTPSTRGEAFHEVLAYSVLSARGRGGRRTWASAALDLLTPDIV